VQDADIPLDIEHYQLPPARMSQELEDVDETPRAALFRGRRVGLAPPEALDRAGFQRAESVSIAQTVPEKVCYHLVTFRRCSTEDLFQHEESVSIAHIVPQKVRHHLVTF
jgi:hypothetical protein